MSLLEKFERYPLTFGPTPIEHLPRLSAALGGKVPGLCKARRLQIRAAHGRQQAAQARIYRARRSSHRHRHVVSIGGVQSNHTRMVAATAAKIGMKCVVIQEKWVPHYDAVYDRVGNILLTRLMGADSRLVDDDFDIGIRKSWQDAIQSVKDAGGRPYPIPAGASVHKFGGLGYVGFAEEVARQESELGFAFDYIIVCVVTGSNQAGMIVGFAAQNRADRVIGIDASGTLDQTRAQVRRTLDDTAALVELGRAVREDEIVINPDYGHPAYSVPSDATNDAIRLAARTEAIRCRG
ncbi:MAG: pyridoxal-phosphate dependent enzyme [Mesorhizobium sp.]|uniref:pyridoxal-phosphate dependent enzyme n=1 Tax=Mesorhizobium sp. TaxID=1871066 RepID=UPI000FE7D2E8|nr:pyridoxal-phosphate dependent enzyme [Mesorhizobium sp.]RWD60496.1 MAG: pyridoxal-phosphate dependent enzyme [Mesorhizobium sp.]RWE31171.1 MAG: pyridoxal-phosphate dependent enzyme [Mesorhizobium sp.]